MMEYILSMSGWNSRIPCSQKVSELLESFQLTKRGSLKSHSPDPGSTEANASL